MLCSIGALAFLGLGALLPIDVSRPITNSNPVVRTGPQFTSLRLDARVQVEGQSDVFYKGYAMAGSNFAPVVYCVIPTRSSSLAGVPADSPFARFDRIRSDRVVGERQLALLATCGSTWVASVQGKSIYVLSAVGNCDGVTCPTPPPQSYSDAFAAGRAMVGVIASKSCAIDNAACTNANESCKPNTPTATGTQASIECSDRGTNRHNCSAVYTMVWSGSCSCQ